MYKTWNISNTINCHPFVRFLCVCRSFRCSPFVRDNIGMFFSWFFSLSHSIRNAIHFLSAFSYIFISHIFGFRFAPLNRCVSNILARQSTLIWSSKHILLRWEGAANIRQSNTLCERFGVRPCVCVCVCTVHTQKSKRTRILSEPKREEAKIKSQTNQNHSNKPLNILLWPNNHTKYISFALWARALSPATAVAVVVVVFFVSSGNNFEIDNIFRAHGLFCSFSIYRFFGWLLPLPLLLLRLLVDNFLFLVVIPFSMFRGLFFFSSLLHFMVVIWLLFKLRHIHKFLFIWLGVCCFFSLLLFLRQWSFSLVRLLALSARFNDDFFFLSRTSFLVDYGLSCCLF